MKRIRLYWAPFKSLPWYDGGSDWFAFRLWPFWIEFVPDTLSTALEELQPSSRP